MTKLITHEEPSVARLEQNINEIKERLQHAQNLVFPLERTYEFLEQLTEFALGQFLLMHRGLSGYWISYVMFPEIHLNKFLTTLEEWIIFKAPVVCATQERFRIFEKILAELIQPNMYLADVACGIMDQLFSLSHEANATLHLTAIDLDPESIHLAKSRHDLIKKFASVNFYEMDAWELSFDNAFDVLISNGLNFYEPDDDRVIALYKNFYQALKPSGILVTSFLTPSPALSADSSWCDVGEEELKLQRAIFGDILKVRWQVFRTEKQTQEQLYAAGFKESKIYYDRQRMMPTIVAYK